MARDAAIQVVNWLAAKIRTLEKRISELEHALPTHTEVRSPLRASAPAFCPRVQVVLAELLAEGPTPHEPKAHQRRPRDASLHRAEPSPHAEATALPRGPPQHSEAACGTNQYHEERVALGGLKKHEKKEKKEEKEKREESEKERLATLKEPEPVENETAQYPEKRVELETAEKKEKKEEEERPFAPVEAEPPEHETIQYHEEREKFEDAETSDKREKGRLAVPGKPEAPEYETTPYHEKCVKTEGMTTQPGEEKEKTRNRTVDYTDGKHNENEERPALQPPGACEEPAEVEALEGGRRAPGAVARGAACAGDEIHHPGGGTSPDVSGVHQDGLRARHAIG
mmetsp:Transcript_36811/g.113409  ORF Transcript_36811/g.113409 Transcript_36811/m.113409 type:complete len:341 (-) Transcript_36811:390-1412(-)